MSILKVHTQESAPDASQPILQKVTEATGFLPNLFAVFAESPAMTEAYAAISASFEKTELSVTERQVVLMTNNYLNTCHYCMAAHTTISQMQKIPAEIIDALRAGTPLEDPKLEALRVFSVAIHQSRGYVSEDQIDAFLDAGYTRANVLDVILGTSMKVLSNYTNHIAVTPLDEPFKKNAWSPEDSVAA